MNKLVFLVLLISTNVKAVINGKVVSSKDYSYIVNLQNERGNWCSAILIGEKMIATVPRCIGYNKVLSSDPNIKVERWLGGAFRRGHIGILNNQIPGKFSIDVNFQYEIGDEVEMIGFGVGDIEDDIPSLPLVMRAGRGRITKTQKSIITVEGKNNVVIGPGDRGSALFRIKKNGKKEIIAIADYGDLQSLSIFNAFTFRPFTSYVFREIISGRYICGLNTSCENGKMTSFIYPQKWLIAGTFEFDSNGKISDYVYAPEKGNITSNDTYQLGKIKWQEFDTRQSNHIVKYLKMFPKAENKIAYQVISLKSSREQKIKAVIFKDDGVEVFVNGKKVFSKNEIYWRIDLAPNKVSFDVAKGENQILIKISKGPSHDFGQWECLMGFNSQHPISFQAID